MALYRSHRGSLEDSLKTTVIVKSITELKTSIRVDYRNWISKENFTIKIEPYGGLDERTGWYTQIVTSDLFETGVFGVMGFLSEPLDGEEK